MIQCYQAKCPTIYSLGQIFRGLKFHESIKSAKFAEFKYLEKTNYTVYTDVNKESGTQCALILSCCNVSIAVVVVAMDTTVVHSVTSSLYSEVLTVNTFSITCCFLIHKARHSLTPSLGQSRVESLQ